MADKKIQILFVTDQLLIGGAERQLIEMCKRFDRDQFELFLFCTIAGGHLKDEFESLGVVVHVCEKKTIPHVSMIMQLARYIRSKRIDIVHSWLWYSTIVCYLSTRLSPKVVWIATVHGIHLGFGRWHTLAERLAYRAVDHLTTVSHYNRRILLESVPESAGKSTVIFNGIDAVGDRGSSAMSPTVGRGKVIGCIANFGKEKGHVFLVRAMSLVVEECPDVELLLVGEGALRPQIEAEISKSGLADRIHLLGRRDDVPDILARLDFAVLPSLIEGMPIAILEAMVARLPVVATRVGGIPEIVDDGETGLLVDSGNPEDLAGAMVRLLKNRREREMMGAAAYCRAVEVFGIARTLKSYEALYFDQYLSR